MCTVFLVKKVAARRVRHAKLIDVSCMGPFIKFKLSVPAALSWRFWSPSLETALRLLAVDRILTSALEENKLINHNGSRRKPGKKKKLHKEDLL